MKLINQIQAVIVDDEQIGRDMLVKQAGLVPGLTIVGLGESVESGVHVIDALKPDLVILDIMLTDGTGFDVLKKCNFKGFEVIFVTAFDQYAIKAFQYSAIDYLLKPIEAEKLEQAVQKLTHKLDSDVLSEKLTTLLSNKKQLKKLAIPTAHSVEIVRLEDIIRLQGDGNYTTIHLTNERKIVSSKTLKEYDQILSGSSFFRVHKSHLVNIDKVERFLQGEGGWVVTEDGIKVEVARRRKDAFLKTLMNQ